MSTKLLATSLAVLCLAIASPSFAQEYTLNGTAVPEDQVARIQAHCSTLGGSSSDMNANAEPDAPTADATGTEAAAETEVKVDAAGMATTGDDAGAATDAAGATAATGAEASTDNTAGAGAVGDAGETIDFATLDVNNIDQAACTAGGFLTDGTGAATGTTDAGAATGPDAGAATGTDAGAAATGTTTTN